MTFQQFIQDFDSLKQRFPHCLPSITDSENSHDGDYLAHCNNSYYCFDTSYSDNIIYQFDSHKAKYCVDGDYIVESENCYECIDIMKAYNSTYLNYCARIYDSHFCYDCNDSHDLFGCSYLNHKQYCIFNTQYTEEEYFKKLAELKQRSPEENVAEMAQIKYRIPVTTTTVTQSENSDYSNHVHYSKDMYLCFDSARSEYCAYLYDSHHNKHCFDMTQTFSSEFCYECTDCTMLNNCFYMKDCDDVFDSGFSENCTNSNHLLGCYGLRNQEYCIFNVKYTKEEYMRQYEAILSSFRQWVQGRRLSPRV